MCVCVCVCVCVLRPSSYNNSSEIIIHILVYIQHFCASLNNSDTFFSICRSTDRPIKFQSDVDIVTVTFTEKKLVHFNSAYSFFNHCYC